jgi:hypothetical protein
MFVLADRVKETTITSGAGSVSLNAGLGAYQTFASGVGDGNQTYYAIENDVRWEVGVGTYTSATNSLARDTVLRSSNAGSPISLDGVSTVFSTYPADRAVSFGFTNYLPEGYPLTLGRTTAGNFFHTYVDNASDETVALHMTDESTPTWKLGLKGSPSSKTSAPTYGYVYGKQGQAGLYGHTDAYFYIDSDLGFVVSHESANILQITKDAGSVFTSATNNVPVLTIKGYLAQSDPLQIWSNSVGSTLSSVGANGYFAINQSSASYPLDVNGTANVTTLRFDDGTSQTTAFTIIKAYRTIAGNTTISATDEVVFINTVGGPVTATLPTAVGNGGKEFSFKRLHDGNNVTIKPNGSEKIDSESSFSLHGRNEAISVVSDNSNWYVF